MQNEMIEKSNAPDTNVVRSSEMRDRLIELIVNADTYDPYECNLCTKDDDYCDCCYAEKLADHLIANGVILPPCKVGDTVWFLFNGDELCEARIIFVEENYYTNPQTWLTIEYDSRIIGRNTYKSRIDLMLGKIIFFTREEAEKKLKER